MNDSLLTDRELSSILQISDRRIRQLFEEDRLIAIEPGRYCPTFAIHSRVGEKLLSNMKKPRQNKFITVACSWLQGHANNEVTDKELKIWFKRAKTWGLSRDDALAVLANAQRILGTKAPKWRINNATS